MPLGSNEAQLGGSSVLYKVILGRPKKNFLSKINKAYNLGIRYATSSCGPLQRCSNYAPGVNKGPARGAHQ